MDTFLSIHQDSILGTLATFDRMIFKGHLTYLFPKGAFARFLSSQDVLLKDFGTYVETSTQTVKKHVEHLAQASQRPYIYLASAMTQAKGQSKEEQARAIAQRDHLTEGLVCVFATLEVSPAFAVQGNRQTHHLEVVRRPRKCLHFYLYYLDPEFGLIHIRLQSWFPFEIQVYLNGREWLARQLDQQGIPYERYDNCFTRIGEATPDAGALKKVQQLCERFAHRKWPRLLNALAQRVNPHLTTLRRAGFGGYYWVLNQAEYATDVMFQNRAALESLYPALVELAMTTFSADDVFRFLGRKPHGNFQGEVSTNLKRRVEGRRVKHWLKRNSLKMYDKGSVLRIETTINNPREFKILRVVQTPSGRSRRWLPMNKGVANLWRYAQVGAHANARYLDALAHAQPNGKAIAELDRLCQPHVNQTQRYARFNPVTREDSRLFLATLAGEHALNGFRNKDLQARLYDSPVTSPDEQKRRSARVSRLIAKLRGHGLVTKVQGSRLYRISENGYRLMSAAIHYRQVEFPKHFQTA